MYCIYKAVEDQPSCIWNLEYKSYFFRMQVYCPCQIAGKTYFLKMHRILSVSGIVNAPAVSYRTKKAIF